MHLQPNSYLDTRRHGYIEVTQYMLCVLILGAFPQKRQKPSGILVTVSDLNIERRWAERARERGIKEYGAKAEEKKRDRGIGQKQKMMSGE